jgi:Zn-dependent peptidase ImmA (M78 family)
MSKRSREWILLTPNEQNLIELNQQSLPIKVGKIAKDLGVNVKASTLEMRISGEIKRIDDGKYEIRVNRHDTKYRQRFTVAHEIAHYLIHRDRIGDGIVDDILYRSTLSDMLEAQANRLAADILMPMDLILDCLENFDNLKNEEKYEKVAEVAEVSTTALKIRLGKL